MYPVTLEGDKIPIALKDMRSDYFSAILFLKSYDEMIKPEYLMMWFQRPEFDRYAWFHAQWSCREFLIGRIV